MTLAGHDKAWRAWRAALAGERMHHAWLFAGRKGLGKSTFAHAAARELVAEAGLAQPSGMHPDIIELTHLPPNADEEKKRDEGEPYQLRRSITVDQIREMQRRLTTRPTLGSRRAIIIDPLDDLEKAAANALLKSLEEPPSGSYFLLVVHRPGRLLATIRSRCRTLRFPDLSDADIAAVLREQAPQADNAARRAAVAAGHGSPGAALSFLAHDLGAVHGLMDGLIREGDPEFTLRGALAEAIGPRPDRERVQAVIDLARATMADRLPKVGRQDFGTLSEAYTALERLAVQAPTYNFDPGLLVMEIGGLLASAAMPREAAT